MGDNHGVAMQFRDARDVSVHYAPVTYVGGGSRELRLRPGAVLVQRDEQIARMWRAVWDGRSAVTLITITGPLGAGSTVLAEMFLHEVRHHEPDRFTGGVRTVDLRQGTAERLSWDLLSDFGVPPSTVPVDPVLRSLRYRRASRDLGAMALLIDNAATIGAAQPLFPAAPGSVVVLTANQQIDDVDRADPHMAAVSPPCEVGAGPLSAAGAARLLNLSLARMSGAEELTEEAAQAAVARGDRYPLSISLTAGRCARGGDTAGDAPAEEAPMNGAIAASYEALPDSRAALLRALAWHPPGGFGPELVAAVFDGAPEPRTEIEALRLAGLVTLAKVGGHDRYELPGPVRAHALRSSRRSDPAEGGAVLRRIGGHYLGLARGVSAVLLPGRYLIGRPSAVPDAVFADQAGALDRMELERAAIAQVVEAAFDAGEHALVCDLCEALWAFYLRLSCYPDWIHTHGFGVRSARAMGGPARTMLSRMLIQLARPYADRIDEEPSAAEPGTPGAEVRSNRNRAYEHTEAAVDAARASGQGLPLHTALEALGKLYETDGGLRVALDLHTESLRIAERLSPPDPRAEMNARHQVGRVQLDLGLLDAAEANTRSALRVAEEISDDYNIARISTTLGTLYTAKGERGTALGFLTTAVELHEAARDGKRAADALVERGCAVRPDNEEGARADLSRAAAIYTVIGHAGEAERVAGLLREWDLG
ncbi:tetratricopeptide repeat protein [Murinocardiopsis flavida]|nr:tetratricopeptide repeat protein [Murinocardiopsis flavida]